jgi:hypothetical protein
MTYRVAVSEEWRAVIDELATTFHKRPSRVLADLLEYSSPDNLRADYEDAS